MSNKTLIVPFVPLNEMAIELTRNCVASFKDKVNAVILIQNGVHYPVPEDLKDLATYYRIQPFNILMAGAINEGFLIAKTMPKTEFLIFANNDTKDENTDLEQLCRKGMMLSPRIQSQHASYGAHASFFCRHYEDFEKVGFWNLTFGNAADEQWFKRAQKVIGLEQIPHLSVIHDHPAFTNGGISELECI